VASVWIRTRTTKDGGTRYLVEDRDQGRESKTRHAGSFRTRNDITPADVAQPVAALAGDGKARDSIRKSVTALAMVLDFARVTPNPAREREASARGTGRAEPADRRTRGSRLPAAAVETSACAKTATRTGGSSRTPAPTRSARRLRKPARRQVSLFGHRMTYATG
jgi:hypothetical protein